MTIPSWVTTMNSLGPKNTATETDEEAMESSTNEMDTIPMTTSLKGTITMADKTAIKATATTAMEAPMITATLPLHTPSIPGKESIPTMFTAKLNSRYSVTSTELDRKFPDDVNVRTLLTAVVDEDDIWLEVNFGSARCLMTGDSSIGELEGKVGAPFTHSRYHGLRGVRQ